MTITLTCYGGVGSVTGANFMLKVNNTHFLVDCGMVQGSKESNEVNNADFDYEPSRVGYLCVTHAHMDHIGRIPKLVHDGFEGVIYSTPVTRELAEIMFEDALGVMEYKKKENDDYKPLYEKGDVTKALSLWRTSEYYNVIKLTNSVELTFHDSGHILGSAMCEFVIKDDGEHKKFVFTGDLGNESSSILRNADTIKDVDYMLMESVYGDRNHEDANDLRMIFKDVVSNTLEKRGVVMIPAFSIERTQEVLYLLNDLIESRELPSVPVYLDSPLAIEVTEVFQRVQQYMSEEAKARIASGDDIFDFPKLVITRESRESRTINDAPNPKIVIAGSGMSTGGRILHHEKRYLPDENSTLLLVGYQAIGTLGRELEEGAKRVEIDDEVIPVRARIERIQGFSGHMDGDHLVEFVSRNEESLKKVFVTMGEPKSSLALVQRLRDYLGVNALYPTKGKEYTIS